MIHLGVRAIGIADGIDTNQEGHELIHGVKGIVNQTFLKDLKAKIKRGMEGPAAKCYWQGGRVYGYNLVPCSTRRNRTATGHRRRSARA